jgi:organic hydroperoxide reductase OsmC/OhrA
MATETECVYRASACCTSDGASLVRCESSPSTIHLSDATEFGGSPGRWTPAQLFLCALAGSFITTFHDVARAAMFEYADLEVEIVGIVRRSGGNRFNFSEILIRPRLTVSGGKDCQTGLALLRRTKALCMISRAINVPQILKPIIEIVNPPVEGWSNYEPAVTTGVSGNSEVGR